MDTLVFMNGRTPEKVYLYYFDNGVFGQSNDYYLASDTGSIFKNGKTFFASPSIIKIKKENDSLKIILIQDGYRIIDSTNIKFKVVIDSQTWKY